MLKNNLLIAFRQLRRKPGYTLLNILGLSIAMTVSILIGVYIYDEYQVNRFHENVDRIVQFGGEAFWGKRLITPYPLATALEEYVPAVERSVRTLVRGNRITKPDTDLSDFFTIIYTDPAFFEVFTFPPFSGNPIEAIKSPDGLLITERVAEVFFGTDDPLGEILTFGSGDDARDLVVRAVLKNPPTGSTIRFDALASLELIPENQRQSEQWRAYMYGTYALLSAPMSIDELDESVKRAIDNVFDQDGEVKFFSIPLTKVYLSDLYRADGFQGQMRYTYIFGSAAIFLLILAGINYVNLSTAQGVRRGLEIGVRKTMGAQRHQLITQFLIESVVLSFLSLVVAILLIEYFLPIFNEMIGKELIIAGNGGILALLAAFVFLVGVSAGAYPAFVLSTRSNPVYIFRYRLPTIAGSGGLLRRILIVIQFAISSVLIIGTAVIYYQLHYIQTKDHGFDGEGVVVVHLDSSELWRLRSEIKQRVVTHPGIQQATTGMGAPGMMFVGRGHPTEYVSPQAITEIETFRHYPAVIDFDYIETLGMRLAAGRNFSEEHLSDERYAYIINETAAKSLGWTSKEAIGKQFSVEPIDRMPGEVIGVVRDYHTTSLHEEISPVVLQLYESKSWSARGFLIARLEPGLMSEAIEYIQEQLITVDPDITFTYSFLDEHFNEMYKTEQSLRKLVTLFAVIAILIACLGLFGLSAYSIELRTKEIGIRKVLGASVNGIVMLLWKEFIAFVVIGFIIAAPLAYYVMNRWLEDFVYRISLGPVIFIITGLLTLAIALITVSYKATKAALTNPVESLKYE